MFLEEGRQQPEGNATRTTGKQRLPFTPSLMTITLRLFDRTTTRDELEALKRARPAVSSALKHEREFTLRDYMGHTYPPYRPIAGNLRPFFAASRIEACPSDPAHGAALESARRNRERIAALQAKERGDA